MGQVRWVGWAMAAATALVVVGGQPARADVESDKPAAIVIYPDIKVINAATTPKVIAAEDTVIRLTNTNQTNPILVHCFYIDANDHCSGGHNDGYICTEGVAPLGKATCNGYCATNPTLPCGVASDCPGTDTCTGAGTSFCLPAWQETDFRVLLTASQPIEWKASDGLHDDGEDAPYNQLPLPNGVCVRNPTKACGTDADCNPFPGGSCTQSNQGTRIPPVPETPFRGELKCIAIDQNGNPIARNDLKGEVLLETSNATHFDVASYNAIGIQAGAGVVGATNELVLGGPDPVEYNGCPNYLILNHFFDEARDPVPGTNNTIDTNLVLVPCSQDLLRQVPGLSVAQYLVFNEFEQRFSTSKPVRCYQDLQLCNIDTLNCTRSIWNVNTAGTLTGQTRINPIGVSSTNPPGIPSGLLGVAVEKHKQGAPSADVRSAAFNLHMKGSRDTTDVITIP